MYFFLVRVLCGSMWFRGMKFKTIIFRSKRSISLCCIELMDCHPLVFDVFFFHHRICDRNRIISRTIDIECHNCIAQRSVNLFPNKSDNYNLTKKNKFEIHMGITGNGTNGYLLDTENGDCWFLQGGKDFKLKLDEK